MRAVFLLFVYLLSACSSMTPEVRRNRADALAFAKSWQPLRLSTHNFVLAAYVPAPIKASKVLTIYIEGDGLAWLNREQSSDDPTPLQPIALQLALQHVQGAAAYLARPCQYVSDLDRRGCDVSYWTDRRFAPPVIDASSQAIDELKRRYEADALVLVGYSGGGAVAALVAAGRHDVVRLVTVAGNLDHRFWTVLHRVTPLTGSLNPADAWNSLQGISQLHFVGSADVNITPEVVSAYLSRFPIAYRPEMQVVPNVDHSCCWVKQWTKLSLHAFP
ncbi:alpha/beta hydrolase [Rhodoferax fermentans]|uniref:Alpha/beta hydrolase n=2 Tax=Rhodoferax fermentans TaxID=28066 RepID=A0A1T1AYJ9_RHOFE|nr:alpha/beta hydrolase [Rhodoferax fermentans]OOV09194.1 alpha/beta hydrolase [Rhodoferax fermentans]